MAYQPKSYKKFVATAATATLVASAIAPVASAATFTDVNKNYTEAVNYLVANKIAQGTSDTTFGTTASITRGDAAVMIANALGLDTSKAPESAFTDLNTRVKASVNALSAAGIINGKSTTQFAPDDNITRAEMAKVIALAYKLDKTGTTNEFTDVNSTFDEYVDALVKYEITLGKTESLFGATQNVTRGEFALFVFRAENLTPATPEVVSVSAINATQVEVKFNSAIDPASVFTNGASGAFLAGTTVSLTSLDSVPAGTPLTGALSADGKTLTITSPNVLEKRYDVVVDGFVTVQGKDVVKYEKLVAFAADKTAPTVVGTSKPTSGTVKVTFSEPIKSLGTVSFKLANGTPVTDNAGNGVLYTFVPGSKEVTFTLGSEVPANGTVTATFVGLQDQNGNLISPNPSSVSLFKGVADGVAPTVTSISQTSANKFAVKFSEEIQGLPTVTLNGAGTTVAQDADDSTRYIVTAATPLDGASTVAISNFTDLSGVAGTPLSKVVTFVKDGVAPKVLSSAVVADATTKKEYLELTFDKDVAFDTTPTVDATSGSYVKDFVTTSIADGDITLEAVSYKAVSNKKVIRVELDALLNAVDFKGAVYTLNLAFDDVTSAALVPADTTTVTFTRGEDGVVGNTDVLVATSVAQGSDNNKVNVVFDRAVDGASATNIANYSIDGAVVESVTLLPVAGDSTQTAVVNLKANSNGFTGTRNITISNVKALGSSKVMTPKFVNNVPLNENVAATVTTARLTDTNEVTLTFSEAVTNGAAADFELYIGGNKIATNDTVTTGAGTGVTTLVLTLEDDVTAANISSGLVLKAVSSNDIVDGVNNKLSVPTAGIVITQ